MKIIRNLSFTLCCILSACAVNSSELKSTSAADLTLQAHFYESNDSNRVTVDGQIETTKSHIKVEFDQGEELYVSKGVSEENLEWDDFSDSFVGDLFEGLDEEYIRKPADGEKYYIKYVDSEGNETIISVDKGFVTELTSPEPNINVANTVELTWDPNDGEMNGKLYAVARYESGSTRGYISKPIEENDGSFIFDISEAFGTGTVALEHVTSYDNIEGFSRADVDVSTMSSPIDVTFPAPPPPAANVNRSLFKSARGEETAESTEEIAQNKLDECLHECETGETSVFFVDDEEYSCCLNVE